MPTTRLIQAMRARAVAGATAAEIARELGQPSGWVWKMVSPERRAMRAAQLAVSVATRRGTLVRSERCEGCGGTERRTEGHHADYTRPLDVEWLCPRCHKARHPHPYKGRSYHTPRPLTHTV